MRKESQLKVQEKKRMKIGDGEEDATTTERSATPLEGVHREK
jgi:hypothetical protein